MGKQSLKGLRRLAVRGIVRVHLYVDTYEGRAVLWGLCLFLGLLLLRFEPMKLLTSTSKRPRSIDCPRV